MKTVRRPSGHAETIENHMKTVKPYEKYRKPENHGKTGTPLGKPQENRKTIGKPYGNQTKNTGTPKKQMII